MSAKKPTYEKLKVRFFKSLVDDGNEELWFGEAYGHGGWVFAETPVGQVSRNAAVDCLYAVVYRKHRMASSALRAIGSHKTKAILARLTGKDL